MAANSFRSRSSNSLNLNMTLARRSGGIALVASVAGYIGLPNASVYGPSKAALINLAEILYSDLHVRGINVYLINPGFVKTELTEKNDFAIIIAQKRSNWERLREIARGNAGCQREATQCGTAPTATN